MEESFKEAGLTICDYGYIVMDSEGNFYAVFASEEEANDYADNSGGIQKFVEGKVAISNFLTTQPTQDV